MAHGWGQARGPAEVRGNRRGRTAPEEPATGGRRSGGQRLLGAAVISLRGLPVRAAFLVGICAAAYEVSLATLLDSATHRMPLASLGLVPVVALIVAGCGCGTDPGEADIHDRYLDYIVGIPLLLAALIVLAVLPVVLAALYWHWRLDLVSLPLFVAGAVALCFGSRALWRVRFAILVLCLASPGPWLLLLGGPQPLAAAGLAPLRAVLTVLPLAQPLAGGQAAEFMVLHRGQELMLSVDPAAAWMDRVMAFLYVAIPVASVARGRAGARMAWLLAGAAATWLLYNLWLLGVLVADRVWGQRSAMDLLGPGVGLVVFAVGAVAALAALPQFGLRGDLLAAVLAAGRPSDRARRPAVPRPGPALAIVLVAAAIAAVANQGLRQFQLVEQPMGQPLRTQQSATQPLPGWSPRQGARPPWAVAAVGRYATWLRYRSVPAAAAASDPGDPPLTLDVFEASSLPSLAGVGVDTVRPVRADSLTASRLVDLGGGVFARSAVYRTPSSPAVWLAITWDWPVRTPNGDGYERVVLSVTAASGAELGRLAATAGPTPPADVRGDLMDAIGGCPKQPVSAAERRTLDLLAGIGRQVVLGGAGGAG